MSKSDQCKHKKPRETCSLCDLEELGGKFVPKRKRRLWWKLLTRLFIAWKYPLIGTFAALLFAAAIWAVIPTPHVYKPGDQVLWRHWDGGFFWKKYTIEEVHGKLIKVAGNEKYWHRDEITIRPCDPTETPSK